MLRISDLKCDIGDAFIDAFIDEEEMKINFGLTVSSVCSNPGFERWKPKATIEIFTSFDAGEISSWRSLDKKKISWIEKYNEEDEMYGTFYVFENNPIYESTLQLEVVEDKFQIKWLAKSDVNWNEKYGQSLELEINTSLPFKGIWCGRKTENESLNLVKKFFNSNDFVYTQTEHGVSLLVPVLMQKS